MWCALVGTSASVVTVLDYSHRVSDSSVQPSPTRRLVAVVTRRESRFLVVGGFNTVFGLGVFAALHAALGDSVPYLLVLLPTYAIGIVVSFITQRLFVFQVTGTVGTDLARFTVVQLGALALNAVVLPLVEETTNLPVVVAQAVALGVVVISTYFSHLHFSFRRSGDTT